MLSYTNCMTVLQCTSSLSITTINIIIAKHRRENVFVHMQQHATRKSVRRRRRKKTAVDLSSVLHVHSKYIHHIRHGSIDCRSVNARVLRKFSRQILSLDRRFLFSFDRALINTVTSIHIERLFISCCVEYICLLLSLALSILRGQIDFFAHQYVQKQD